MAMPSLGYGLQDRRIGFDSWQELQFLPNSTAFLPNISPISLSTMEKKCIFLGQNVTLNTHLYTASKFKK
jgi:hypothetical protein